MNSPLRTPWWRAPWRRPATLAGQLTRTLVLWVGGVWLACVAGTVWYVDSEINFNFDHELVEVSHRMFDIALDTLDRAPARAPGDGPLIAHPPEAFDDAAVRFQVVDASGRVLLRSADTPAAMFDAPLAAGFVDNEDWRLYTVPHPTRPLFLQVADPLEERSVAANRTLYGLIVLLCAVLPLLGVLLWRIARAQLHSLEALSDAIALRDGAQLQPIALAGLPLELQQVCDHVNRLLERLAHALDVERSLAANAAHELRTPLTAARLRLQTVIDGPPGVATDGALHVKAALQSLETLSQRAEKLLQLSRAESGRAFAREPVELPRVAAAVAEDFWAVHGPAALQLTVGEGEMQSVPGDADVLAIALRNLVENALRHGGGTPVEIEVMAPATLAVRDGGPGAPRGAIDALVQRHVRRNAGAGYGLGLSIVKTVVDRHGGQLQLLSPPPGRERGFEARIVLPTEAPGR